VIVERARADFPALLARATVSVSQAGYNTALDVLRSGARPCSFLSRARRDRAAHACGAATRARNGDRRGGLRDFGAALAGAIDEAAAKEDGRAGRSTATAPRARPLIIEMLEEKRVGASV
jgi:hypothetical protein